MMGIVIAAALGGPFPLLSTPYTEKGEVDYAVLRKEAKFVADCGANGVIWPAADDALKLLTPDEERLGWRAIAEELAGRDIWFCPCCPGTNVTDQLRRLAVAEEAWRRSARSADPTGRMTALVRMVDDATNDVQYAAQYEAVAAKVKHPVIIQTYNGIGPMPSMKLMVELAKRHPDTYGCTRLKVRNGSSRTRWRSWWRRSRS